MDSKFYVSLEAARLLKEKGYNEPTEYLHSDDIIYKGICLNYLKPKLCGGMKVEDNVSYPCPTKAEAIDWLESNGIGISIIFCEIEMYEYVVELKDCYYNVVESGYKETRLEAEEAAIIGALKLL